MMFYDEKNKILAELLRFFLKIMKFPQFAQSCSESGWGAAGEPPPRQGENPPKTWIWGFFPKNPGFFQNPENLKIPH